MFKKIINYPFNYYRRYRAARSLSMLFNTVKTHTRLQDLRMIEVSQSGIWVHVLDGRKFKWDVGKANSLLTIPDTGVFEEKESNYLRKIIKPGMTVVDCGANFGWYTTLLASLVGPTGSVHCFEPIPTVYGFLRENISANSFEGCVVANNFALGNNVGRIDMVVPLRQGTGTPFASFKRQTWGKHVNVDVEVSTLDKYCEENKLHNIGFIKCDVEGAEFLVMQGAGKLFASGERPVIMLELVEASMQPFGFVRKDIYQYLAKYNYAPHYIDAKEGVVAINHSDNIRQENIFFLHDGK